MNMKRFSIVALTLLALIVFALLLLLSAPDVAAQAPTPTLQPTPTLVPPLSPPASQNFTVLSQQIYQSAEFSLYNYYNTLTALDYIVQMQQQISNLSSIISTPTLTIPTPLTVTLADDDTTYSRSLSSGGKFKVEKRYSYGEAAIVFLLLALIVLEALRFTWDVTRVR